jgi:hypothetical protein
MFLQRSWVQWSPDAARLALVETKGRMVTDPHTLLLCDASVQCAPLLDDGSQTVEPAWSPDGSQLAFVRNEASLDANDYVHDGEPDWAPRYAVRKLWVANADGSFAHEVKSAGGGVGVPTWTGAHTIAFTTADGRLREVDLTTGRVHTLVRLAASSELPPSQVYDPADANRELQWTDLFAFAPGAPVAPAAPATPDTWAGKEATIEDDEVVAGRRAGLYPQAGACTASGCGGRDELLAFTSTKLVPSDKDGRGYVWLVRRAAEGDVSFTVRESVAVHLPAGLAFTSDCGPQTIVALVRPSNVNGALQPVSRAWSTDATGEHIVELDAAAVECRVTID